MTSEKWMISMLQCFIMTYFSILLNGKAWWQRLSKSCLFLLLFTIFFCLSCKLQAQTSLTEKSLSNAFYQVSWPAANVANITYTTKGNNRPYALQFPTFEINGQGVASVLQRLSQAVPPIKLSNGETEYSFEGVYIANKDLRLVVTFQVAPDNPVLRFRYQLKTSQPSRLTKKDGKDNINYLSFTSPVSKVKEVRLSEFNERFHATNRTEAVLDERYFTNGSSFMGPIAVVGGGGTSFLVAYEHGSQYPNRFLQFTLNSNNKIGLEAVKGNYLHDQAADDFQSVWFNVAGIQGDEDKLAEHYRDFVLRYLTMNKESRKPYIFYNTWGRQERVQWTGKKFLTSMNLEQTLKEIDRAHEMGIEVFVIDAGWFKKTGDWEVNKELFPDELKQVKAKLNQYKMKLGLWFNPIVAAVSSDMYKRNRNNQTSVDGKPSEAREIWETEQSIDLCMVSDYWEDFANRLIVLTKELGVSYFKWDAVGQYGCNAAGHQHGTEATSLQERAERYAYLQPAYMVKIIEKVAKEAPQSIFDFDITEDGRCVGLQFLSAGKYFIINNGPYYHNYDLAPVWKSVLPNGNPNIFVQPGPARGWFVRSVLDYDKWIPSVLFLTHYQPDEPRNSQFINLASLILGQNGIWGEILKTSNSGVELFDLVLSRYKNVRDDITTATLLKTGEPGGSPEIYEKINPKTGKGCVVIFASAHGNYQYITKQAVANKNWKSTGVDVKNDAQCRAIITMECKEATAKIIFFGTE